MLTLTNRRGAALPMTLLIIAILTAAIVASFLLSGTERRIGDSSLAQSEAFSNAESGLQQFLTNRSTLGFTASPPGVLEQTRINLTNGYADVTMQRLRPEIDENNPAIYIVRSQGVSTRARLTGLPQAARIVSEMIYWSSVPMKVNAGWTSLTGLHKNGGSGTLGGADACGAKPAVGGVAVPTAGYSQNGGSSVPSGSPPIVDLGTGQAAQDAVKIDWNGIVNQNAITPDITIPPAAWPSFSDPNYYPVIKVVGNATIPDGRGTLIITGDATISGSTSWEGVVLVGNNLTSNGNNTISGAIVTGLNVKLGMTVPAGDVGNGNKTFQYNSCAVTRALSRLAVINAMPNTWMDNWPSY